MWEQDPMFDREHTTPGRLFTHEGDFDYGEINPDGWLVFTAMMEGLFVLISLAVFLFIRLPYRLIKKARK